MNTLKYITTCFLFVFTLTGCTLFGDNPQDTDYTPQPPKAYKDNLPPPVCLNNASKDITERGWYQSQVLVLKDTTCEDGKLAICLNGGGDDEGWYTSELGEAIEYRDCIVHSQFAIYFINANDDDSCAGTRAAKLTVYKETPGNNVFEKTLNLMLAGPPAYRADLNTSIPQGTQLISASYDRGKVTANFSSDIDVFGSCSQDQVRAQIEKTLKYIPVVTQRIIKEIEIQVDGEVL
jgi:hypothetical protein